LRNRYTTTKASQLHRLTRARTLNRYENMRISSHHNKIASAISQITLFSCQRTRHRKRCTGQVSQEQNSWRPARQVVFSRRYRHHTVPAPRSPIYLGRVSTRSRVGGLVARTPAGRYVSTC